MIPSPFAFLLLALAAYRVFRLLAEDEILDRPRAWLLGAPGWKPADGEPPPTYRVGLAAFLTCPYCLGFWLSAATWGFWIVSSWWTVTIAVPFALSAILGLVAKGLDP